MPKLVAALFRDGESATGEAPNKVLAVTSPQLSEGVSTISLLIARELARNLQRQTLLVSTAELETLAPGDLLANSTRWEKSPIYNFWRLVPPAHATPGDSPWETDPRFVRDVFFALRTRFDAVLIDCGPLLTSHDFSRLGHLIDGAIVVIQADRSTKQQIERALQVLTLTGSTLKGFVLNRQTYPIPERIYRWLRS